MCPSQMSHVWPAGMSRLGHGLELAGELAEVVSSQVEELSCHTPSGDQHRGMRANGQVLDLDAYQVTVSAACSPSGRAGHAIAVTDVADDSRLSDKERQAFPGMGVRAFAAVPLVKEGAHVASLMLHQTVPRVWGPAEMTLVEGGSPNVPGRPLCGPRPKWSCGKASCGSVRWLRCRRSCSGWSPRWGGGVRQRNWITSTGVDPAGMDHRSMLFAAAHPDDISRLRDDWSITQAGGGAFEGELRLRQRSGGFRPSRTRCAVSSAVSSLVSPTGPRSRMPPTRLAYRSLRAATSW